MYQFLPHTADIAVQLEGVDLPDLFRSTLQALLEVITDPEAVEPRASVAVELGSPELELLLVDWASEVLYRFDARRFLSREAAISVEQDGTSWRLRATVRGEDFDESRHHIKVLVKAVTYHALRVEQTPAGWRATLVFDI